MTTVPRQAARRPQVHSSYRYLPNASLMTSKVPHVTRSLDCRAIHLGNIVVSSFWSLACHISVDSLEMSDAVFDRW